MSPLCLVGRTLLFIPGREKQASTLEFLRDIRPYIREHAFGSTEGKWGKDCIFCKKGPYFCTGKHRCRNSIVIVKNMFRFEPFVRGCQGVSLVEVRSPDIS
jgi:hypothetical protein